MFKPSTRIALSERPFIDTAAAAGLAALHGVLISRWLDPWSAVDTATRQVIFQTGAGVVAVVAALAAIGLAAGGAGERGKSLRRLYGKELRRNWRALLLVSAASPTAVLIAQVAEGNGADWAPYLFEFGVVWTALRIARLTWLIDALTEAEDLDAQTVPRTEPLPVTDDFLRRTKAS
ncbi:MAG: hypothetical protein ABW022_25115 [Actinoplanes sp.]